MKPYHHEYKIMGLAPFANSLKKIRHKKYSENFKLNKKITIEYANKPDDLYFSVKELIEGHRFDGIAGGLQECVEKS